MDEDYIEDDFNLSGLSSMVPYYEYALDMILDNEPPQDMMLTEAQQVRLRAARWALPGLRAATGSDDLLGVTFWGEAHAVSGTSLRDCA